MALITCPECKTEYEKEAKYCFKCRIAFTDDIPENISKYLRHKSANGTYISKSNTSPSSGSSGQYDKPPLNRNTSLPTLKNNSPISTGSPVTTSTTTLSSTIATTSTSTSSSSTTSSNRPRLQSSPVPPTHPLPPTPNRMSVPVHTTSPPQTITSPTSRQPPPPPTSTATTTKQGSSGNLNQMRTISPVNTPPDTYASPQQTNSDYDPNYQKTNFEKKRPLSRRIPPPPPNQKLVRAIWDCVPEQEGDLAFKVGDIISVITKDDESGWWMGTCHGITGLFPANYCVDINEQT